MIKTVKFGGSSLASSEQFKKVKDIITADESRRYVVPSAPGKKDKNDFKITDKLYECYELAFAGKDINECFGLITGRYNEIIKGLGLDFSLDEEYESIKYALLHNAGRDYMASRGEYLNALILAKYLDYDFINAKHVIFFKDDGSFDSEKTNEKLSEVLKEHPRAVIPGFYGSMPNGTIKTFSRGGSDITGAIVARAAGADLYENWTDVSGFLMADPRIVDDPKPIETITYTELRELSYMGATVLHEDAIFPVRIAKIPINIKNTNQPEARGTMIVSHADSMVGGTITGIAGKKDFSFVTVEKDMMNTQVGFGRRVLEVFEKLGISFEHIPSGIDTMSVIVKTECLKDKRSRIISEIKEAVSPECVSVEDGLALIAIVGRNMVRAKGTAAKIISAIAEANINIRMIDQGSSEMNIIIGVDSCDFESALRAIYDSAVRA